MSEEVKIIRFAERWTDPAQLERLIIQGGMVHENTLIMRGELSKHFLMVEVQSLGLLDLCRLYCDLVRGSVQSETR